MTVGVRPGRASLALAALATLAAALALAPLKAPAQTRADPEAASGFAPRPLAEAAQEMIVTANPLASAAGAAVLREGGTAADAAIAALLVLNVVEPQSSGLGGGGFALHWDASAAALTSWDGRETAPATAEPDMFLGPADEPMGFFEAASSGLSIGAPGAPALLEALHARFGALPMARLAAPAIGLAEEGFAVSPRLAALIDRAAERLGRSPAAAAVFLTPGGAPLAEGTILRNPRLAETLRRFAAEGAAAFRRGPIAAEIVAAVRAGPVSGGLSAADLAAYAVRERAPICVRYRARYDVCGMGPPSSGGVTVGQILGMLEAFPMDALAPGSAEAEHLFIEASDRAFADRGLYLADTDFQPAPISGLLDRAYLAERAAGIPGDAASPGRAEAGAPPWRGGRAQPRAADPAPGAPGTTHVSVVDAAGNVLSLTASVETAFGSARMAGGFLLNNQLTDFSFRPERGGKPVANRVEPGKRPRSSMAPTIVFEVDGDARRPVLALGSPGGSRIIEYVARAVIGVVDHGLDPAAAAARAHVSSGNRAQVAVENRPDGDALAEALAALGHDVTRRALTSGLGVIQIRAADGALAGGADPRREGVARGR